MSHFDEHPLEKKRVILTKLGMIIDTFCNRVITYFGVDPQNKIVYLDFLLFVTDISSQYDNSVVVATV